MCVVCVSKIVAAPIWSTATMYVLDLLLSMHTIHVLVCTCSISAHLCQVSYWPV